MDITISDMNIIKNKIEKIYLRTYIQTTFDKSYFSVDVKNKIMPLYNIDKKFVKTIKEEMLFLLKQNIYCNNNINELDEYLNGLFNKLKIIYDDINININEYINHDKRDTFINKYLFMNESKYTKDTLFNFIDETKLKIMNLINISLNILDTLKKTFKCNNFKDVKCINISKCENIDNNFYDKINFNFVLGEGSFGKIYGPKIFKKDEINYGLKRIQSIGIGSFSELVNEINIQVIISSLINNINFKVPGVIKKCFQHIQSYKRKDTNNIEDVIHYEDIHAQLTKYNKNFYDMNDFDDYHLTNKNNDDIISLIKEKKHFMHYDIPMEIINGKSLYDCNNDVLKKLFRNIKELYDDNYTKYINGEFYFKHNDLHGGNLLYRNDIFYLIDYGVAYSNAAEYCKNNIITKFKLDTYAMLLNSNNISNDELKYYIIHNPYSDYYFILLNLLSSYLKKNIIIHTTVTNEKIEERIKDVFFKNIFSKIIKLFENIVVDIDKITYKNKILPSGVENVENKKSFIYNTMVNYLGKYDIGELIYKTNHIVHTPRILSLFLGFCMYEYVDDVNGMFNI